MNLRKITIAAGAALSLAAIGTIAVLAAPSVPRPFGPTPPAAQANGSQENETGNHEDGPAGQSDKQDNQTGEHEDGAAGQSDKQDNETGNHEDGPAGQSDKQDNQTGEHEDGPAAKP